jgi:hypothetical protein
MVESDHENFSNKSELKENKYAKGVRRNILILFLIALISIGAFIILRLLLNRLP